MNATHPATLALLAGAALAAAAADVCYEGRLLDASGAVRANETIPATLRAYETEDAPTAFAEKGIEIATDADGLFAATASVDPPAGLDSFWIGVAPGGSAEIRPRMRVSPVPFSIVAASAELLSSAGPISLRGVSSVGALAPGASVAATNATLRGDAVFRGGVTGAGNVYFRDLDPGDGRLSMLRTAGPDGISTRWENFAADVTLDVDPSGFDKTESGSKTVVAADDGIAMVMVRAVISDNISFMVEDYVAATLHNGDFAVLDRAPLLAREGAVTRLFTFPVRKGMPVYLALVAHRRGWGHHALGQAKIKMVYFGAN